MNNSAIESKKLWASSVDDNCRRCPDIHIHQSTCLATNIQNVFRLWTKIIVTPAPNDNDDDADVDNNDCKNNKKTEVALWFPLPHLTFLCVLGVKIISLILN
jgi:predicted transcriptional regulator